MATESENPSQTIETQINTAIDRINWHFDEADQGRFNARDLIADVFRFQELGIANEEPVRQALLSVGGAFSSEILDAALPMFEEFDEADDTANIIRSARSLRMLGRDQIPQIGRAVDLYVSQFPEINQTPPSVASSVDGESVGTDVSTSAATAEQVDDAVSTVPDTTADQVVVPLVGASVTALPAADSAASVPGAGALATEATDSSGAAILAELDQKLKDLRSESTQKLEDLQSISTANQADLRRRGERIDDAHRDLSNAAAERIQVKIDEGNRAIEAEMAKAEARVEEVIATRVAAENPTDEDNRALSKAAVARMQRSIDEGRLALEAEKARIAEEVRGTIATRAAGEIPPDDTGEEVFTDEDTSAGKTDDREIPDHEWDSLLTRDSDLGPEDLSEESLEDDNDLVGSLRDELVDHSERAASMIGYLERLVHYDPTNTDVLDFLAEVYERTDHPEQAVQTRERVTRVSAEEAELLQRLIDSVPEEVQKRINGFNVAIILREALPQIVEQQTGVEYISDSRQLQIIYSVASPELRAAVEEYYAVIARQPRSEEEVDRRQVLEHRFRTLQLREAGVDDFLADRFTRARSNAWRSFGSVTEGGNSGTGNIIGEFIKYQRVANVEIRFWNDNLPRFRAWQDSLIAELNPEQRAALEAAGGPPAVEPVTTESVLGKLHEAYQARKALTADSDPATRVEINNQINSLQAQLSETLGLEGEESFQAAEAAETEADSLQIVPLIDLLQSSAKNGTFAEAGRILTKLYAGSSAEFRQILNSLLEVPAEKWKTKTLPANLYIQLYPSLARAAGVELSSDQFTSLTREYSKAYQSFENLAEGEEISEEMIVAFRNKNRAKRQYFEAVADRKSKIGYHELKLASEAGMEII